MFDDDDDAGVLELFRNKSEKMRRCWGERAWEKNDGVDTTPSKRRRRIVRKSFIFYLFRFWYFLFRKDEKYVTLSLIHYRGR